MPPLLSLYTHHALSHIVSVNHFRPTILPAWFVTLLVSLAWTSACAIEPFTVRIQSASCASTDTVVRVDVTLEEGWVSMAAFDFLIVYDSTELRLLDVERGALHTACGWADFSWHHGPRTRTAPYDRATDSVRVTAAAESGSRLPSCYMVNQRPFALFTLVFRPMKHGDLENVVAPVRFFWYKCTDNSITVPASPGPNPHNSVVTVGQSIFEPSGWEVTSPTHGVPGYQGPPGKCITFERESPVPFVNLVNGHAWLNDDLPPQHSWADLNLNGQIAEIEDSWLLAKALLYGDTVLSNHPRQQAAADIDGDGAFGTIADLTLLMRLVTGEYVPSIRRGPYFPDDPFHPPPPRLGQAVVTVSRNTIQVETADSIISAHFVFDGDVRPELYTENLDLNFAFDGSRTRALVYGFFTNAAIESGLLLHWTGQGRLESIEMATATGGLVSIDRR